jgi:hypothetical protein
MGYYNCTFVLKPQNVIPELFEYHGMKDSWFGLAKTVTMDREKYFKLQSIVYRHLGKWFRPYYSQIYIDKETVLTKEEVDELFADFQQKHPESDFDVNDFLVEELQLDLDEDGSAYRDCIFQKENEETFEGRFDSFSPDTHRIFVNNKGQNCSIIKVADLDLEKTKEAFDKEYFGFVLDENGKMKWMGDDNSTGGELFVNYINTLNPECVLVFARLHD